MLYGVVSLYGDRIPGVLIPHWKMTPTCNAIRSHRRWMYAFAMSFSGRKGESFHNVKYLQLGSSHVMRYLSAAYKKGGGGRIIIWWINSCCSFSHVVQWLTHTLTWRVILLQNFRTTVGRSYLTLTIDSYTTWNMNSSIVNVHICFTILSAKRQSSVKTVYLKKYIVGSPLIMWLDDYGCICTYYLMALLNLRKGSYFIISRNNSQSAYRTLQNESHTHMGEGVIQWCIKMIPGILFCRWKITPTHHALRPDRKGMCANLVLGTILWYFEMISGVFIWLRQNKLYGLIDSECRHTSHAILRKKGDSFDYKMRNLQLG